MEMAKEMQILEKMSAMSGLKRRPFLEIITRDRIGISKWMWPLAAHRNHWCTFDTSHIKTFHLVTHTV